MRKQKYPERFDARIDTICLNEFLLEYNVPARRKIRVSGEFYSAKKQELEKLFRNIQFYYLRQEYDEETGQHREFFQYYQSNQEQKDIIFTSSIITFLIHLRTLKIFKNT